MARIALGCRIVLYLGNLSALRDWGHAKDYVEMQWLMLHSTSRDFVIATGVQYSVRQFVELPPAARITLEFSATAPPRSAGYRPLGRSCACKPGSVVFASTRAISGRPIRVAARRRQQGQGEDGLGAAHSVLRIGEEMCEATTPLRTRQSGQSAGFQAYDYNE